MFSSTSTNIHHIHTHTLDLDVAGEMANGNAKHGDGMFEIYVQQSRTILGLHSKRVKPVKVWPLHQTSPLIYVVVEEFGDTSSVQLHWSKLLLTVHFLLQQVNILCRFPKYLVYPTFSEGLFSRVGDSRIQQEGTSASSKGISRCCATICGRSLELGMYCYNCFCTVVAVVRIQSVNGVSTSPST